jgi:hypothetical protein
MLRLFKEWTDTLTGHPMIGGIDASKRMDWASKVPGAMGYLAEPIEQHASFLEKAFRSDRALTRWSLHPGHAAGSGPRGPRGAHRQRPYDRACQ